MTRYHTKHELIAAIVMEHRRLDAHLAILSPQMMLLPGVVGFWTTKDLIAHLTAWEQLLIYWYDAGQLGVTLDPCPTGMSRRQIDACNANIYNLNRKRSLDSVVDEYLSSFTRVLAFIRGLPEEGFFSSGSYLWTGHLSLADYVAANTCQHYFWGKTMVRRWLKQQDIIPA